MAGTATVQPHRIVVGTSGRPLPGLEPRPADPDGVTGSRGHGVTGSRGHGTVGAHGADGSGEVLPGGPTVFAGYLDDPSAPQRCWTPTSPLIGLACAIGEGRPSITAPLVLDRSTRRSGRASGGCRPTYRRWRPDPELLAAVEAAVARANERFNAVGIGRGGTPS